MVFITFFTKNYFLYANIYFWVPLIYIMEWFRHEFHFYC